jgi:hypothetical protein
MNITATLLVVTPYDRDRLADAVVQQH